MMRRSVGERVENLFVLYVLFDCCIVEVVRGFVLCCVLEGWVVWGGGETHICKDTCPRGLRYFTNRRTRA